MSESSNGILMAGFGWIGAGIVSLAAWRELSLRPLSGGSSPGNMLYIAILVIAVGISILAFRKRIDRYAEAKKLRIAGSKKNPI